MRQNEPGKKERKGCKSLCPKNMILQAMVMHFPYLRLYPESIFLVVKANVFSLNILEDKDEVS